MRITVSNSTNYTDMGYRRENEGQKWWLGRDPQTPPGPTTSKNALSTHQGNHFRNCYNYIELHSPVDLGAIFHLKQLVSFGGISGRSWRGVKNPKNGFERAFFDLVGPGGV